MQIPRVVSSRSIDNFGSVLVEKRSKNAIKQMIIEDALNEIVNPSQELSAKQQQLLRDKLNNLRGSSKLHQPKHKKSLQK